MKYRKNAVWAVAMLLHAPDYLLLPKTDFGRFIGCPTWPDESAPPFFVGEGDIALSFVIGVTPDALPKAEYVFLTYPNSDKGCPPVVSFVHQTKREKSSFSFILAWDSIFSRILTATSTMKAQNGTFP